MKKSTVKVFILALALGGGISASAQTLPTKQISKETKVGMLNELTAKYEKKFKKDQANILKLAASNNWPLIVKKADGTTSRLVRVTDAGIPIYVSAYNMGSAITSRTNHLQPGGSLGLNLTGEFANGDYMEVGIWDEDHPRISHMDLVNRVTVIDEASGTSRHSTHVLGTMIGGGVGDIPARGMAYKAMAYAFSFIGDGPEMSAYSSSLLLSNHSYGLDKSQLSIDVWEQFTGSYVDTSKEVDEITFAAPYYLPVFAAGNDGDGMFDRLTEGAVSKNAIAVAAVYQVDEYVGPSSVEVTSFSSWGPTNDNRIKPDIATKGFEVYSSTNESNTSHGNLSGTSMAAPGVTGSLLLLQQYYSILHPSNNDMRNYMRSATVRALVAHTADEAGDFNGPDPIYGWGLLNAKRGAEILKADSQETTASINELILLPGQVFTKQIVALGTEPLVATLAWTDPAGAESFGGSQSVLVNDLDIKITKNTTTYYPWKLNGEFEAASATGTNSVDNIEKVEIPNATGTYTVTISHKKATLKNPGGTPQQAYSLIMSGINATGNAEDFKTTNTFNVWPNPANDVLNISLGEGAEKGANAAIYDIQGRLVLTSVLAGVENSINVQGLVKGIYMVTITNGAKTEVEKIIIK